MTAATVSHCQALAPRKLTLFGGGGVMDVAGDSPYNGLMALGADAISQDLLSTEQRLSLGAVIQAVKREGVPDSDSSTVSDFQGLLDTVGGGGAEVVVVTSLANFTVCDACGMPWHDLF